MPAEPGRLLLRTPGPIPFGPAYRNVLTVMPVSPKFVMFLDFEFRTSLGTSPFLGTQNAVQMLFIQYLAVLKVFGTQNAVQNCHRRLLDY